MWSNVDVSFLSENYLCVLYSILGMSIYYLRLSLLTVYLRPISRCRLHSPLVMFWMPGSSWTTHTFLIYFLAFACCIWCFVCSNCSESWLIFYQNSQLDNSSSVYLYVVLPCLHVCALWQSLSCVCFGSTITKIWLPLCFPILLLFLFSSDIGYVSWIKHS